MFRHSKSLGLASFLMLLSAGLLILLPPLFGYGSAGILLIPVGIVYGAIACILPSNRRWLAWLALFVVLFGGIAAMSATLESTGFQSWWNGLMIVSNWLAAAALFAHLWQGKPKFPQV